MKSEFDQGRHAEEVTTGRGQGTGLNVSVQGTIQGDASSSTHEIESLQECYVAMRMARAVDEMELELVARGEAFFQASGAGHEGMAMLHQFLIPTDWLHLHYRDKALMLARGVTPSAFFHGLLATAESSSGGRQMTPFMSEPSLRILSQVTPVGNHALQAVGVASVIKDEPDRPIVVCTLGDGTSQQGEVLEAIAEAVRSELPVLFVIEDNAYSISTPTRHRTFYSLPPGYLSADRYYGLQIHRLDGRDVASSSGPMGAVVSEVRHRRGPAIVVIEVDRLASHSNADDERVYRPAREIEWARRYGDPLRNLEDRLIGQGVPRATLSEIETRVLAEVWAAANLALESDPPVPEFVARPRVPQEREAEEYRGQPDAGDRLTMCEAIRQVLRNRLASNPRVTLLGQDIEDPKGDVFGVTRGLSTEFPGRVVNSALAEATIVGVAIGQALAGHRPVGLIQFADFLPLAFNQILSELGSIHWRTRGSWRCPVILMASCGGYRPGLGPFHAQTMESILAHVPGIDVLMPAEAADAAGLLNSAFESGRPTVFLYPKALLNDRERTTSSDLEHHRVPIGRARQLRKGNSLTMVAWGNTVALCDQAAEVLAGIGISVDLFDLRSISPWDHAAICESARRTRHLLVAHEDNLTCGFGAEVVSSVVESVGVPIACKRVARPDTYIPFHYANQLEVLPSFRRIITIAAELLDLEVDWTCPPDDGSHLFPIEAVGPSPADQSITVVAWDVSPGDSVGLGQHLAELEADKSVYELRSTVRGRVEAVLVPEGQTVRSGTPLLRIEVTDGSMTRRKRVLSDTTDLVRLRPKATAGACQIHTSATPTIELGLPHLSAVTKVEGSASCPNDELAALLPAWTGEEILLRTGIESRRRLAEGESALTMAADAARIAIERQGLTIQEIDALICSTSTPLSVTPSMACLILHELCRGKRPREIPAYDVLAACSGYLYALAAGFDFTRSRPDARVLIVTTEAMSRVIDPVDFDTMVLFGDAATATILYGPTARGRAWVKLCRPILSARGEDGRVLSLGASGGAPLRMDGRRVFSEAVRQLSAMILRVCGDAGLRVDDLDLIVPHQANGRILDAVRKRLGLTPDRIMNNLRHRGNTSSSSIPVALSELADRFQPGSKIGLTAFGGGFTSGAAILEVNDPA